MTFALLLASTLCLAETSQNKAYVETDIPFSFHGRLTWGNGTPCFRIWIVGTHRLLGVPGGDLELASMPRAMESIFSNNTTAIVYADFKVTPLTSYKEGSLQMVRVDAATNLVIYSGDRFVERRKTP